MKKAVLLICFNRLDTIKKVFEQIAIAKPPRLYLSSDGARANKEGEDKKIEEVREFLLTHVEWECEVKTKFNKENLGCAKGVSSAITWFFENEEDGIILEDDTVPHQSFFKFCEEMLDLYKDNKSIWHIAGNNPYTEHNIPHSYFFCQLMLCWGWASWRDRWQNHFTLSLKDYNPETINIFDDEYIVKQYQGILKKMNAVPPIDSWAYPWVFQHFKHKALCITPRVNLVSNIGIDGVHYQNAHNNPLLNTKTFDIYADNALVHPTVFEYDKESSALILSKIFPKPVKNPPITSKSQNNKSENMPYKIVTNYRLISFIPLFKKVERATRTDYYLFNFIPILRIKTKEWYSE